MTERDVVSPDSPSVEVLSAGPDPDMLQSVELSSPQSVSSIEIIPEISDQSETGISSISQSETEISDQATELLASPDGSGSTVEVISPEPEPMMESLESSVSSDMTLVSSDMTLVSTDMTLTTEHGQMEAQLEAAMVESEKRSSESGESSEIVRVEMTSDTTSSDIEIIRRNSGQSLSTGHTRNSSDQSSLSPEPESVEELRSRNKELSDVLAARESRLMAVSREIIQVQEESGDMAMRLQEAMEQLLAERSKNQDLEQRTKVDQEQVTVLKKELVKLQQNLKAKGGDDQEKDDIITDLRSEGEALAKQNGKLSETIRKLRAKEKTHGSEVTKLKSDLDKNVTELERLRKSLNAKNELEGNQSETIKTLTDANKAWETESKKLKSDLEDNVEKVLGLRSSLEGAYREMAEMKRKLEDAAGEAAAASLSKEVSLREEAVARLEEERRNWNNQKQRLELQVVNLQDSLQMTEASSGEREDKLRQEIVAMRLKLEQSDRRQEDMSDCVGQATKPLLRQIETLQSSLREVTSVQERVEQSLGERLTMAQQSLAHAQERERSLTEKMGELGAREATSSEQVRSERERRLETEARLAEAEERLKSAEDRRGEERRTMGEELTEARREKEYLTASLGTEKTESEGRRRKCLALMEQLKERDRRVKELQAELETRSMTRQEAGGRSSVTSLRSVSASPTPSHMSDTSWMPGTESEVGIKDYL